MCNPYRDWLGLPEGRQSFTAHELLGVAPGAAGAAVLEEAALRRLEQVRPYQVKYPRESTRLLNEISQALLTALGPASQACQATRVDRVTKLTVAPPCARAARAPRPKRSDGLKVLVLCQGDVDGTGDDVTVWRLRLEKVPLTDRQRQKLRAGVGSGSPKARVLGRIGRGPNGGALVALVQKGLASVKRVRSPA